MSYDDVFRTMLVDCQELLIPLVNEMFRRGFTGGARVTFLQNTHAAKGREDDILQRISDSIFKISEPGRRTEYYALESQSDKDDRMVFRMFEYMFMSSREHAKLNGAQMHVHLPRGGVLYLRSSRNTPDRMTIRLDTERWTKDIPVHVMRMADYDLDVIIDKQLFFLLPFYIFRYEKHFKAYRSGKRPVTELRDVFQRILEKTDDAVETGKLYGYYRDIIYDMIRKVLVAITKDDDDIVRKEVDAVMGGRVLSYPVKETYNKGVAVGQKIGEKIGEKRGERRGERRYGTLVTILIDAGKEDDLRRAAKDDAYRAELYKEYGIK